MIRILCPEPTSFSSAGLEFARSHASLTARAMDQAEFEREAPGYDAVLIRFNTRVGESVMQREEVQRATLKESRKTKNLTNSNVCGRTSLCENGCTS